MKIGAFVNPGGQSQQRAALDGVRRRVRQSSGLRYLIAVVWAVLVGLFMAGGASLFDVPRTDVLLIGVLGGLGAAASVLVL